VEASSDHKKPRFLFILSNNSKASATEIKIINKFVGPAFHDIACQGKVSLFMLALPIGFVGK